MWKMQGSIVICALTLAASVVNGQNEGCGLAVLDKCYRGFPLNGSTPDILVETVGEIPSVIECQWFCKELYNGECTWFAFDTQTSQCNIFKGNITDYTSSCELVGYPKEPNVADCSSTLTGDDACYNFREGYCRFEDYVILENLQFVQLLEHCQEACRHRPDCKFFLYEEKDKVCHLEGSQKRNCDVVHGLPDPPFGECLIANKIPFTAHGEDCAVEECLSRCDLNYSDGNEYYCKKACALVGGGKVIDPLKYCNMEASTRFTTCSDDCSGASSGEDGILACRFGCEFWIQKDLDCNVTTINSEAELFAMASLPKVSNVECRRNFATNRDCGDHVNFPSGWEFHHSGSTVGSIRVTYSGSCTTQWVFSRCDSCPAVTDSCGVHLLHNNNVVGTVPVGVGVSTGHNMTVTIDVAANDYIELFEGYDPLNNQNDGSYCGAIIYSIGLC